MLMQVLLQMLPIYIDQNSYPSVPTGFAPFFSSILVLVSDQASLQVFYYTCQTKRYQRSNNNDDTLTDHTVDSHMIGVSSLQFFIITDELDYLLR